MIKNLKFVGLFTLVMTLTLLLLPARKVYSAFNDCGDFSTSTGTGGGGGSSSGTFDFVSGNGFDLVNGNGFDLVG